VRTPERPRTAEKRRVGAKFWVRAAAALARTPRLWPTALGQAGRLSRPGWWRHPPFLPVPDPEYVRFRLDTQYGSGAAPDPEDLVVYLRWCQSAARTSLRPE
jgi:hypothetical protein